jgi:PAS domain S-box-containing protein
MRLLGQALESGEVATAEFSADSKQSRGKFTYGVRVARCGHDQAVAVVADTTARTSTREDQLRQSVAFRHVKEAIIVTTVEGRIVDLNAAAERIFGYSLEELNGKGIAVLYAPDFPEEFNQDLSKQLTEFGRWEARTSFFRKNGRRGFGEVVFLPVEEEGMPHSLVGVHREISDDALDASLGDRMQHRLRNQLQQVSSLFSMELEASPDGTTPPDLPKGVNWLQKFQVRLRTVMRMPEFAEEYSGPVRLPAYAQAIGDDVPRILGVAESIREVRVTGDTTIEGAIEVATPFGLLVGELVFSALSHPVNPPLVGEP